MVPRGMGLVAAPATRGDRGQSRGADHGERTARGRAPATPRTAPRGSPRGNERDRAPRRGGPAGRRRAASGGVSTAVARRLLLRASRSAWLASQLRHRAFLRRAVRRFLPGEDPTAALDAAAELAKSGIGALLTELGEQVTSPAEAAAVRDRYRAALDRMRERGLPLPLPLPAQLSVKLTHLGLDMDREACA